MKEWSQAPAKSLLTSLVALVVLAGVTPSGAAPQWAAPQWVAVREIPASEAFQAAAADRKFLYAISGSSIGKYDRETGKRIATSSGKAEHLNSGFFWKEKLVCAHSNYPSQPEKSQIMVMDPETMKLTVLHDFGSYGGSLTWVVRHEDHWWANFARYGKANHETFLVKSDREWKELARFTYPAELVQHLGRFSLSGGIWRSGELLVTDHDHRVLHRLRIPEKGRVLEYLGKQPAPFTGQGIAADPVSGGLVGIDRARRRIIIAKPRD